MPLIHLADYQNRNRNNYNHWNDYQRNNQFQRGNYPPSAPNFNDNNFGMNPDISNFRQIPETIFTVHCGEIRPKDEGVRIKISGKVNKRPHSSRFLEIKDLRGCTQLVANDDRPEIQLKFQNVPSDAYISVIGTVQQRLPRFINKVIKNFFFKRELFILI